MNRKDFIKKMISIGAVQFIPLKQLKSYEKIYLLQCFVAGFCYYDGIHALYTMKENELLELVREPNNPYDANAIALHWNNIKIGYIPKADNEIISKLLDANVINLVAEITHLNVEVESWENVSIAVSVLKERDALALENPNKTYHHLTVLQTPTYYSFKEKENDDIIYRLYDDEEEMGVKPKRRQVDIKKYFRRLKSFGMQ